MGVIREAWVDKSSGGKKDASTGTLIPGKENWKKRYVVVEDKPAPTLSWYKTDKAFVQGKAPRGQIELEAATCELLSTVLGTAIMCIHTAGLRDFIMKVPATDGDAWMSVVMDNGASEDAAAAAKRLQALARQKEARKEVVKRFVEQQTGSATVEPDGAGMMLYVRAGKDPDVPGDCPFCHKVLMALRLKDISPTIVTVSTDDRAPGLSLMGQNPGVPTLALADGKAFTESEVILEYLQRDHGDRGAELMVDGNEDIARALSPLWDTLQAWYAEPPGPSCPMRQLLEDAIVDLEARCASLLPDAYLLNTSEPSAIDCNMAPKLFHLQIIAKTVKGWDFTDSSPKLGAYMDRVFSCDAFQETAPSEEDVLWGASTCASARVPIRKACPIPLASHALRMSISIPRMDGRQHCEKRGGSAQGIINGWSVR